eukprot:755754-Hanusia_phi.AAC.2
MVTSWSSAPPFMLPLYRWIAALISLKLASSSDLFTTSAITCSFSYIRSLSAISATCSCSRWLVSRSSSISSDSARDEASASFLEASTCSRASTTARNVSLSAVGVLASDESCRSLAQ